MRHILIIFGTTEGQTEKISGTISDELKSEGHEVKLVDSRNIFEEGVDLNRYEAVLIGGSVHGSHFQKPLRKWIKQNVDLLSKKRGAFFSVCLGILQKDNEKVQQEERCIVENFLAEVGWKPDFWEIFPGALSYSKYGWLKKRIMRAISKKAGRDTDLNRDYEYTDWQQVRKFARRFGQEVVAE